ncbi:UNVERIFIED_CONTAM: hypothetical protein Slati_1720700 [Sesamum latifolium]|uniref:Retrotransposon gag domain-containing protein n=1 Tax=Sesamum latifolium TaxID=2727402 RepID=A0AAW2WWW1_9LAMI
MASKKDQVAMNEKNVVNTTGQSSTGGKIVDTTLSDGLNSASPTEINLKSTPFAILLIIEDKDLQIAQLTSNQEHTNVEEPHGSHKHASFSNYVENEKQVDKAPPTHDSVQKYTHSEMSIATLSVQQLQEMITNTIKIHCVGTTQSSPAYSKSYTKHIDALKMPMGYQLPELRLFDEKGNPRQHIAHFIETCNNAGTDGDLLVKQFFRSLKGDAFDWYVDLEPASIDSWDEIKKKFLSRFDSTRRTVSMVELTNTRQWKDEPVIDYINRWRALSLNCKDKLSEASALEMCIQVGHQNKKPKDEDFSDPATKELMSPIKFPPNETISEKLQSQHMPHYEDWSALDDEDTTGTNVASITPTNDMHVSEDKQGTLPSVPTASQKFRLDNLEPMQIEDSMADMEPFTNGESCFGDANLYTNHNKMQEAVPSKFLTSQPIKELRSKPAPSESNTKEFNKLAIGEMPINENHKPKKPPYSPVFPYVARSDRKSKESSL